MSALVSFMSHNATSHDWLLDRFVGRLSRLSAHYYTHTHNRLFTHDANGSISAHTSAWSACYSPSRGMH